MKSYIVLLIFFLGLMNNIIAQDSKTPVLGSWGLDAHDMPYFSYTGSLPYSAQLKNGKPASISDDPYFLLGNYRFKLFAHVSGEYEIYSLDRSISHFNVKEKTAASLSLNGEKFDLTGVHSLAADPQKCRREFGAGYASYEYDLSGLSLKRVFTVLPSEKINEGVSGFRITVSIKNNSKKKARIVYTESLDPMYDKITNSAEHDHLDYEMSWKAGNPDMFSAGAKITAGEVSFPLIDHRDDVSYDEYFPPVLFFAAEYEGEEKLALEGGRCKGQYATSLKSGESCEISYIIGYTLEDSEEERAAIRRALMEEESVSEAWSKQVDHFREESDPELRRELVWHNYVLEVMANYSDYFQETFISQGCMYLYTWGLHAAPRDENQHALAMCYTNPDLAKSVLRYILKKSDVKGTIPFNHTGNGVVTSKFYQTSDQQLFFFYLLKEYLRITGDYDFLNEEIAYYPFKDTRKERVLHRVGEYYRYLKEDVGLGPHGLVRLGNSDWNDIVFYRMDTKYNSFYYQNESLMNTTMAVAVLPGLSAALKKAGEKEAFFGDAAYIKAISEDMDHFRKGVWDSFLEDHGDRSFAKRMYFNQEAVGVDNMFLEPQGFLMQVEEYDNSRKAELWSEIQKRILDSEVTGARQEEKMELSELYFGSRENGGIWYSLNGPLIIGLSTWNKDAAWGLFNRLTLNHQSKAFPQYWSSYWSSFDAIDSSILPSEGLHAQHITWTPEGTKMTYCAHIHAWLLYTYKFLKEE